MITQPITASIAPEAANDVSGSSGACQKFACPQRRFRVAAPSTDRPQARGCGDRGRGWNPGTKRCVAPNVSEEELREQVLNTQWTPAYTALE